MPKIRSPPVRLEVMVRSSAVYSHGQCSFIWLASMMPSFHDIVAAKALSLISSVSDLVLLTRYPHTWLGASSHDVCVCPRVHKSWPYQLHNLPLPGCALPTPSPHSKVSRFSVWKITFASSSAASSLYEINTGLVLTCAMVAAEIVRRQRIEK